MKSRIPHNQPHPASKISIGGGKKQRPRPSSWRLRFTVNEVCVSSGPWLKPIYRQLRRWYAPIYNAKYQWSRSSVKHRAPSLQLINSDFVWFPHKQGLSILGLEACVFQNLWYTPARTRTAKKTRRYDGQIRSFGMSAAMSPERMHPLKQTILLPSNSALSAKSTLRVSLITIHRQL